MSHPSNDTKHRFHENLSNDSEGIPTVHHELFFYLMVGLDRGDEISR
jgi:hypothetical protein